MKLYSHIVLIVALAAPAFCQKSLTTTEAQSQALAEQAAELARNSEKMAAAAKIMTSDQVMALEEQAARLSTQFDGSKIAEIEAQAAKLSTQFDGSRFADLEAQAAKLSTQFDGSKIAEIEAKAFAAADK